MTEIQYNKEIEMKNRIDQKILFSVTGDQSE